MCFPPRLTFCLLYRLIMLCLDAGWENGVHILSGGNRTVEPHLIDSQSCFWIHTCIQLSICERQSCSFFGSEEQVRAAPAAEHQGSSYRVKVLSFINFLTLGG